MSDRYFIDTNIIVYAHDSSYPRKQRCAQELIFEGMREGTAIISAQVLSEFFITVTKKIASPLSFQAARHELLLLSHCTVIEIDYALVLRAVSMQERFHLSYWDSLILSAAERAGCALVYSEDFSHGQQYEAITCRDPFTG
jgi:predicted nucleic acid-binding protein